METKGMTETIMDLETLKREWKREYHREYYHSHKKPSDCDHCGKTFSSVSARNRHQSRNMHCQLQQVREQMEKLKQKQANAIEIESHFF
jgi:hypothetical protein